MTMKNARLDSHTVKSMLNESGQIDLFVIDPAGRRAFLCRIERSHRLNRILRKGMTLGSIFRMKTSRNKREQADYHSLMYVLRKAAALIEYLNSEEAA